MFIVPQYPQRDTTLATPQERYVRLVYDGLGTTPAIQRNLGVVNPDADAWVRSQYEFGDEVTATDGLIYRYLYDNRGNVGDSDGNNKVLSLQEIARLAGMLNTRGQPNSDFYNLQNPVQDTPVKQEIRRRINGSSVVDGIRFWEVSRATNAMSFLDGRPSILAGRRGSVSVVFAMNTIPDTIGLMNVRCKTVAGFFSRSASLPLGFTGGAISSTSPSTDIVSFYTPNVQNETTDMLITDLRSDVPSQAIINGEYLIALEIQPVNSNDVVSVGQIVFGNRQFAGDLIPSTSGQSLIDFSDKERTFEGLLNVVPRFNTFETTQRISYPIRETARVKRLMASLLPAKPALFYESEDVNFGSLIYGILDRAKVNYPENNVQFTREEDDLRDGQATLDISGLV